MTNSERRIPFRVEFSRILELLADQIYQSPLALLRENTQNAFDAIRMRQVLSDSFEPRVDVTLVEDGIVVVDNGIGMTSQEIETNFWYAGRSGKNTDAARAAGVVGTFGIGAMANFGVADYLSVESESAVTGERTVSSVRKSELSTDSEVISVSLLNSVASPGTTVRARFDQAGRVTVGEARSYLREFVEFVDIPVYFNDELISGSTHRSVLPSERHSWFTRVEGVRVSSVIVGDIDVIGMASGELRIVMESIQSITQPGRLGSIVLLQGRNSIRAMRSGFGLSRVAVHSGYRWGGVIDLPFLQPTAGREALDASSQQVVQEIVSSLDQYVSEVAAEHRESFFNDGFLQWIVATQKYSLCGPLEISLRPTGQPESLETVVTRTGVRYYTGRDESIIQAYASEDEPLVVLSRRSPRRDCERGFLRLHRIPAVDTTPRVLEELPVSKQGFDHTALAVRIERILEEDYFLAVSVRFASISNSLSILVETDSDPVVIYLDADSSSIAPLLSLYKNDFDSFGPFVKDYVRSAVFPRVSSLVPSSTREGSEAFLRRLRSNREWFEYELQDKANLEDIFEELAAGRLTVVEARRRLVDRRRSVVEVTASGSAPFSSVVGDYEPPEEVVQDGDDFDPRPSIDRREQETFALILTSEVAVNGYTCFLALSDRVQREKGDFFLQPHSTEVVWGGRKVIFIFHHHSGHFALYYDILCPGIVAAEAGGGPRVTSTILAKKRTFIPIPTEIIGEFLPRKGERKRLEVRCDVLYLEK